MKSAIMAGLFIITASILMPVTEPISMIIKFFAEKIIGSWFEKSLKLMLEPAIKGLLESTDMPHAYS